MTVATKGYIFHKPSVVYMFTGPNAGSEVKVEPHQVLSSEETDLWPDRAIRHMVDSGIMSPTLLGATGHEELASASTGVVERDGVSDLPVAFGPSGERLDENESAEESEFDSALTDEGVEYPVHVEGNKYRLSDGTVVAGRAKAAREQAALDG